MITNEAEYKIVLNIINELMDNENAGNVLDFLVDEVMTYEDAHYPMDEDNDD